MKIAGSEKIKMADLNPAEKVALVIRTRSDPRPAVQAWSSELARQATPYEILVASTDEDPIDAAGGKLTKADLRKKLGEIAVHFGVPIYLFDKIPRELFYRLLRPKVPAAVQRWADRIHHQRPFSYGAATDEGLLWAHLRGANRVFFFDDDTRPIPDLNILQKHLDLLRRTRALAVTGNYCGAHWLDVTYLPKRIQQDSLAGFLMRHIPTGEPVQDSIPWNRQPQEQPCSWLIGGNCLITDSIFARLCCPILDDTPSTDDLLFGLIASRSFPSGVCKSDLPVIHTQAVGRKEPPQIQKYLKNWAQAVAFWAMLDEAWIDYLVQLVKTLPAEQPELRTDKAVQAVNEFGDKLSEIITVPGAHGAGAMWGALRELVNELRHRQELIVSTAKEGIQDYSELLKVWPRILRAAGDDIAAQISTAARC
jgi:hypothetical protein